jgi:hypothetical protein
MLASSSGRLLIKAFINQNINQRVGGPRLFFGSGDENKTPRFLQGNEPVPGFFIPGVAASCEQIMGTSFTSETRKYVLINKCPEAFNLRVTSDSPAREKFCRCFVEHFFVSSVLFTDQAHSLREGMMNIHNQH